jgi:hypothetical protein
VKRRGVDFATFCLGAMALLCWVVMFLSGHDVWHDVGRPDLWNLEGPPYHDLRAFVGAFYLLLMVLLVHLTVTLMGLASGRRDHRGV